MNNEIKMVGVGDIYLNRETPESAFTHVIDYFKNFDLICCNLEGPLSIKGEAGKIASGVKLHASKEMIKGYKYLNPDVVSLANNHMMDYGPGPVLETLEVLKEAGIKFTGAGANITDALKPAYVKKKNMTFAFLSFEATPLKYLGRANDEFPGIAKLKISPFYQSPYVNQVDLEMFQSTIKVAKKEADLVILMMHWGESPGESVTTYQRELGKIAINCGADMILGHHPHCPQAIEVYKGKTICHSLGNFVFDFHNTEFKKWTIVFECIVSDGTIKKPYIKPAYIRNGDPVLLPVDSLDGKEILNKIQKYSLEDCDTSLTLEKEGLFIKTN